MGNIFILFQNNKRFQFISILSIIILFCVVLNITFSAFTQSTNKNVANIKAGNLSYQTKIDDVMTSVILASSNNVTKKNVFLISNNNLDTKYELTYDVYTDEDCTNKVSKPDGLKIEYSSKTLNKVKDNISSTDTNMIRLVITNNTNTVYYIKLGVNAGFAYNDLVYKDLIKDEYSEDDLAIISYINGVKTNGFPNTEDYTPIVECYDSLGNLLSTTGTAVWNGLQWMLSISNFNIVGTTCHIDFAENPDNWLEASEGTLLRAIKDNNQLKHTLTSPAKQISLTTEALLSYTKDDYTNDYGNSFYFRGNVQNNYVLFAGKCWKIVRVDGNGNIKLWLWNNTNNCNSSNAVGSSVFNKEEAIYTTATGVGFMYGDSSATNYDDAQANVTDSTILTYLKKWYDQNFNNSLKSMLADVIWCNDKSITNGLGYGNTKTEFGSIGRINTTYAKYIPSLICPNAGSDGKLSKFTANDTVNGNGLLRGVNGVGDKEYKIGFITADEMAFAGNGHVKSNRNFYLYSGYSYWTMTPSFFNNSSNRARIWALYDGYLNGLNSTGDVSMSAYVRPSVSLLPNVNYELNGTGDPGSITNPYVVNINKPEVVNVTFDANGGEVDLLTKEVRVGGKYEELPIPTREGYDFLGWNGKNILNPDAPYAARYDGAVVDTLINYDSSTQVYTSHTNNHHHIYGYNVIDYINLGDTYTFSADIVENGTASSVIGYDSLDAGTRKVYASTYTTNVGDRIFYTFTPATTLTSCIVGLTNSGEGDGLKYKNLQLEKGPFSNEFEPYFITSDTTVVQYEDHTLKAIWKEK